jgi:excisionase family DNA binding protein
MCESTEKLLSSRDAAGYLGVSESSIKRWVDSGAIRAFKTSGGHRKIAYEDLFEFVQQKDPEKFRSTTAFTNSLSIEEIREKFKCAMQAGNIFQMVEMIRTYFLQLGGLPGAIDKVIYPAYLSLRAKCVHPSEECLVLHRALDQIRKVLSFAKSKLVLPSENLKARKVLLLDIGYEIDALPTYLAEYCLPPGGQVVQLGYNVPLAVLKGALQLEKPDCIWVSAGGSKPSGFLKRLSVLREYLDAERAVCFRFGDLLETKIPHSNNVTSFEGFLQSFS